METNQPKTAFRSKSDSSTRRKPATVPPRASATAKRAATTALGEKKRSSTSVKRTAAIGTEPLSAEERAHRITVAAYFLAEQRGFGPNHELDDWLAAERSL